MATSTLHSAYTSRASSYRWLIYILENWHALSLRSCTSLLSPRARSLQNLRLLPGTFSPMSLFLSHGFTSTTFPKLTCNFKRNPISASVIPARDRVIDFGKHRGQMLGTLPSKYLKWVSNNLRARDFEEWAKLADEVLVDPIYKDRLEWESAENILTGDRGSCSLGKTDSSVDELLELSERYGWDNNDKLGWSRIDFSLLGTSRGGRIPRKNVPKSEKFEPLSVLESRKTKVANLKGREEVGSVGDKREMRIERQRLRRGVKTETLVETCDHEEQDEIVNKGFNPFPGREALLKKVFNSRRVL